MNTIARKLSKRLVTAALVATTSFLIASAVSAQPMAYASSQTYPASIFD